MIGFQKNVENPVDDFWLDTREGSLGRYAITRKFDAIKIKSVIETMLAHIRERIERKW